MHDWTKDWYTTRYVLQRWWVWLLVGFVLSSLLLSPFITPSQAYVILQYKGYDAVWDDPTVEMNIQIDDCPDHFPIPIKSICPIAHGLTYQAVQEWNAGSNFQFEELKGVSADVCDNSDRINTIGWSRDFCGFTQPRTTLAVTISTYRADRGTGRITLLERDIAFGPYAPWDGDIVEVFKNTMLHELGHVIGLDHPNDYGQNMPAMMNFGSKSFNSLQQDDIDGVVALYGEGEFMGTLENPTPKAVKSGVGLISGWVCDAERLEVSFDGGPRTFVPYGSERIDTRLVCGDINNGFGLLMNYNELGDGSHTAALYADNLVVDHVNFTVQTLGTNFLRGVNGQGDITLSNGVSVTVQWDEAIQGFSVVDAARGEPRKTFLFDDEKDLSRLQFLVEKRGWYLYMDGDGAEEIEIFFTGYGTARNGATIIVGETKGPAGTVPFVLGFSEDVLPKLPLLHDPYKYKYAFVQKADLSGSGPLCHLILFSLSDFSSRIGNGQGEAHIRDATIAISEEEGGECVPDVVSPPTPLSLHLYAV